MTNRTSSPTELPEPADRARSDALTIGTFDGVHRGHRAVLLRTVRAARERAMRPVALTFHPHPRTVLREGEEMRYLLSIEERVARLRALGIERVLVEPFTTVLAGLTAREFFRWLADRVSVGHLIVGAEFRLGRGREAGVEELREIGAEAGWGVEYVPPVVADGEPVSSSRVRRLLGDEGDVEGAARLLGRPFELSGQVIRGDGRGRTLGIPTANLAVPEVLIVPLNGVYACDAVLPGEAITRRAVVNIGVRPTFDGAVRTIELHVPGWSGDLYDASPRIGFLRRLRGERRFAGSDALLVQVRADIAEALGGAPEVDERS